MKLRLIRDDGGPYSFRQLKADNPRRSFRNPPTAQSLEGTRGRMATVNDRPVLTEEQRKTQKVVELPPVQSGGEWVIAYEVQDKTPEDLLAELPYSDKASAKASVLEWADTFLAPLEAGYSKKEVQSWPVKGPAAINHLDGSATAAETMILQAEVDALQVVSPGITVAEVAGIIAAKAGPYLQALAFTSALGQIVNAQIDATTELAEIPPILDAAIAAATAKAVELGLPGAGA